MSTYITTVASSSIICLFLTLINYIYKNINLVLADFTILSSYWILEFLRLYGILGKL